MDSGPYLERIGLDPAAVGSADYATLARLQGAHVTSVPFETLAITGDPFDERRDWTPSPTASALHVDARPSDAASAHSDDARPSVAGPVSLSLPALYAKLVERRRGGFCFELNGLFGWLLAELGFDVRRVAAMVVDDEGDPSPPANHHSLVVELDRPYVVDVGLGGPPMRRPTPLDGTERTDDAGVSWRIEPADRPDVDYAARLREPDDDEWTVRYLFRDVGRPLSYFAPTCEFLALAPESPFTGEPSLSRATDGGRVKLTPETFLRVEGSTRTRREVDADAFARLRRDVFGVVHPDESQPDG